MATKVFLGATNSWANVNNWTGAAIPVTGDDVIVPDSTTMSLTANLDRTADNGGAGLHLNSFYVGRGYTGYIGASGAELKCTVKHSNVYDASITHLGSGEFWFNSDTGTAGHTTGSIVVDSTNASNAMTINGDRGVGRLVVDNGKVTLSSAFAAQLSIVEVMGTSGGATSYFTAGESIGDAIGLIELEAGIVDVSRAVVRALVADGRYIQTNHGLLELTQIGGMMHWLTSSDVASLGIATVIGGTLDLTQGDNQKLVDNLYPGPRATIRGKNNPLVTITNDFTREDS